MDDPNRRGSLLLTEMDLFGCNLLGVIQTVLLLALWWLAGSFGALVAPIVGRVAALLATGAVAVLDVLFRLRSSQPTLPARLLHPFGGGRLFWMPVWLAAGVLAVLTVLFWMGDS